ncbi:hypothetical protein CHH28_07230 [Bacterioplanes sanyensis]|uniref:Fatty acid desaturase domain-containing protein n=1 Tax=Bacterioplanes sanyensis TaxID=1249553 RepID=A0A222FHD1_9GAMM|nr:fatty acid desaturase [Bacterioplanes sanyensis]ASP38477.1 hypothetical protein CHH28_07230 [Bacterioplanes sanyensis]
MSVPRIPSAQEVRHPAMAQLLKQPRFAWPTLMLFVVAASGWLASGTAGALQLIPVWLAVGISAACAYALFTVLHDSTHRAIAHNARINDGVGQLAQLALLPMPLYKMFRFVHMQHHRFTNEGIEHDPDTYVSSGPAWQLPLRWMTLDLSYFAYYWPKLSQRPQAEQREFWLGLLVLALLLLLVAVQGLWAELFWFWLLPGRMAVFVLALAFDYWPHIPKRSTQRENPFLASNNRMGAEWLLTPLLLGQNYHLIHHLYPRVPFYRYVRIWRCAEPELRAQGPLLVDWKGKQLAPR